MTHICSSIVLIRFLEGVSLIMRLKVSFLFIMAKRVGDILVGRKLLSKSFKEVCIGLPYSKMPTCTVRAVIGVNKLGKSVGEI